MPDGLIAALPLLADVTPPVLARDWSTKEVLGILVTATGIVVSVALWAYQHFTAELRRKLGEAERKLRELQVVTVVELRNQLDEATERRVRAEKRAAYQESEAKRLGDDLASVRAQRDQFQQDCVALADKHATAEESARVAGNRIKAAMKRDGAIWSQKVLANKKVDFDPLEPEGRTTPVISLLNLKGGVGKTTATAHLAGALAHRGYRVLLVDLDLQGSLSGLFLKQPELRAAHAEGRLVGDFLESAFDAESANLLDYTRPLPLPNKACLVPTTDAQTYAEMNLSVRWFLRDDGTRDPRFLLRRELQYKRITDKFDVILLDCPPLINVSCVNALAASDYVLVPVMPSAQATDRVVNMMGVLKELKSVLHPSLQVMGVFANRTNGPTLTYEEQNRLDGLKAQCQDVWEKPVPIFETFIRQGKDIRAAEDDRRPLRPGEDMFDRFAALAAEVESRLPTFCRPEAPAPAPAAQGVLL